MRNWNIATVAALAAAAALLAAGGCGPGNGLNLAKVRGKISYKGAPVPGGSVKFEPDAPDAPPAAGSIGADGSFVLSTEEAGDGAVVGPHRIAIIGLEEIAGSGQPPLPDPEKSPREFMIAKSKAGTPPRTGKTAADEGTFTDPSGKLFRHVVPTKFNQAETSELKIEVAPGSNLVEIEIDEDGTARVKS